MTPRHLLDDPLPLEHRDRADGLELLQLVSRGSTGWAARTVAPYGTPYFTGHDAGGMAWALLWPRPGWLFAGWPAELREVAP